MAGTGLSHEGRIKIAALVGCLFLGVPATDPDPPPIWARAVIEPLFTLTRSSDYEVAACVLGERVNGVTVFAAVMIPAQMGTKTTVPRSGPCPAPTMAFFHSHPWTGPDPVEGWVGPKDLCYLSPADLYSAKVGTFPYQIVGVGRWSADTVWICWWSKAQVDAATTQWLKADSTQIGRFWEGPP